MINILMIEDDPEFSEFLGEYLAKYNMKITNYEDPFLGLSIGISNFDILILDLTLPGMDGLEVCEKISKSYDIPIIISSARGDVTDKIMGLQIGADYYLPKPYDPKEMYAVIQSLLRRSKRGLKVEEKSSLFIHEESKMQILFNKEALNLTQAEYEVLSALISKKDGIVSREEIVSKCESLTDSYSKSLDVIIGRLRTKLNDNPRKSQYIHSVRGLGYKLTQ
ncbi:response regulator transcription factor [Poseidonibacter ostreae]|jgi:two-component system, OmpR family, response regulator|uniref:Response regulator n=1 Tax=Poseidonibacter ostreae TaxID=2654171 RepID=A0A6L4WQN7_9BACT|nr:response regulator transcription factor [Poseidonibacter ostreae]KAB7883108.1 response regulator [Poseidonibacter ostreae]KAB7887191.1 response regulator [Poseidonibacter ostreae]KAB7888124.1 response regulator [Poseidonibacter ostreae]MAC82955.1 DNA-binding response regulator [Arcobacter sp.]